jgi:hypothetical protein
MGGHAWFYEVEYEEDVNAALQKLRRREFQAGRYYPAMMFPPFPVRADSPAPGARHASIEAALTAAHETGSRSILDMACVASGRNYCTVSPLSKEQLLYFFGTDKPTGEMARKKDELFEWLERGQGVYIVLYEGDEPSGIFFAGYSFD